MDLVILDFSWYGNPCDPLSDALIVEACRRRGWTAEIRAVGRGEWPFWDSDGPDRPGTEAGPLPEPGGMTPRGFPPGRHGRRGETRVSPSARGPADRRGEGPLGRRRGRRETPVSHPAKGPSGRGGVPVWLRYDLREAGDLAWVVQVARALEQAGVPVFPGAEAIGTSEDKWLTAMALEKAGLPVPPTRLGSRAGEGPFPVIVKPRVGWGARGMRVFVAGADPGLAAAATEAAVVQPFLAHERTLIAAVAAGRPVACIEDIGGGLRAEGRVGAVAFPAGAADLAGRALSAVGLVAGTVDLLETADGLLVLEVNSAPRLTYPHLPEIDLAGPMVDAVVARWGMKR